jgi:hypothetical protein
LDRSGLGGCTAAPDGDKLRAWMENFGYAVIASGLNFLAIHKDDKCMADIRVAGAKPA